MTSNEEQQFLNDLEKKLWTGANKLLPSLDAANYKHVMLGIIFIKYVSDAFDIRQKQLATQLKDPDQDYYLDPEDFGGEDSEDYKQEIAAELEVRDYYIETNTFWVPQAARWEFLQNQNKVVITGELDVDGKKIRSVGQLIDNALDAIEADNPKLKGVLNKLYTRLQIDQAKLGELIDLVATIPFEHASLNSKDILGHVYEYMLGQFALAEGKKGGQFYTPKSIVSLIVQMLEPFKGRVYDPAMGSGGFFVQSENFIREHSGSLSNDGYKGLGEVSIYGQEFNHTTWQLAAMNMAIRGIDFNFGKEPANTYTNDQHPDLRADYVMANPPFNMKEWDVGVSDDDPRWKYGKPPSGNANFAWLQHMLYHLAPNGSLGLLLANGSMSSNTSGEGDIRKALIENDLVECMVALPGQLFTNTQIPACIWFLTKNKSERTNAAGRKLRDRKGEVLFIDARNLGYMKDRVLRDFTQQDLDKVTDTFHNWQTVGWVEHSETQQTDHESNTDVGLREKAANPTYENIPGFCKSVKLEEIQKHDYVLTPGRYVGAEAELDDGEPFADKMARLTAQLKTQFEESDRLEAEIKNNLAGLGFDV